MIEPATLGGRRSDAGGDYVTYEFDCNDVQDAFAVESFFAEEELNRPYTIELTLRAGDQHGDAHGLLGKSATVTVSRAEHGRTFSGIVSRVVLRDGGRDQQLSTVVLVPALTALAHTKTTRIFQAKTAVEILTEVLSAGLAIYDRTADLAALDSERYQRREFCVQYQETDLDFVHRLMEEEGIGYYFTQGAKEHLVLFDHNRSLAPTEPSPVVVYDRTLRDFRDVEPVVRFEPSAAYGSPQLTVRDHDWTQRRPTLEEHGEVGDTPQHEVYEHGHGHHVTITEDAAEAATLVALAEGAIRTIVQQTVTSKVLAPDLPGISIPSFTSDDTARQLQVRQELLHRDGLTAHGTSLVLGLAPGSRFSLNNHPLPGVDGDYYPVKVVHRSDPSAGKVAGSPAGDADLLGAANYRNDFTCLPYARPWRPERATPKPRVYGVQTATVTGPVGMDVFTDQHGRIKAKFNWDRRPNDIGGNDSAWIRVGQTWAGDQGPGFLFIPRVGMEVIVTFVDGDPDRPMVIGCVHNGANSTPTPVPFKATKSVIRTRTVPHGPGYNEISFEDAMGMEEIHVRAEGDLTELVNRNRQSIVGGDETQCVRGDRHAYIDGQLQLRALGGMFELIDHNHTRHVSGDKRELVMGVRERYVYGREEVVVMNGHRLVHVSGGTHLLTGDGAVKLKSADQIELSVGDSKLRMTSDRIAITVGESTIDVSSAGIRVNNKNFPAGGGS